MVERQAVAVLSRGTLMDPEMVAGHPDAAYVLAGAALCLQRCVDWCSRIQHWLVAAVLVGLLAGGPDSWTNSSSGSRSAVLLPCLADRGTMTLLLVLSADSQLLRLLLLLPPCLQWLR